MTATGAADALLSHTWKADEEVVDDGTWEHQPGPITRMVDDTIWSTTVNVPAHAGDLFQSHRKAALPDTKDSAPCDAVVHEFVLNAHSAERVNTELRVWGAAEYMSGREGTPGKSSVGGYHSEVDIFRATKVDAWYRSVHDVVLAALSCVEPGWCGAGEDAAECTADVAGWLNVSRRLDYNTMHGHGGCVWSCVYYADDGAAPDPRATTRSRTRVREGAAAASPPLSEDERSGLLGALLLRTRPDPLVQAFEFTPLAPNPGRLLIFPAHLQHAVMPRALRCPPIPLSAPPWALSLRISVAMNAYAPKTFRPGAYCLGGVLVSR